MIKSKDVKINWKWVKCEYCGYIDESANKWLISVYGKTDPSMQWMEETISSEDGQHSLQNPMLNLSWKCST